MTEGRELDDLGAMVRGRMQLAAADKAIFEREGQRLNSQLMQGEINMATAVLAWIERQPGEPAPTDADDEDDADV